MSGTAEIVGLYESSPTSVASGQQKQVGITADGALRTSGTTTSSVVGPGTGATATRVIEASDSPLVTATGAIADAAVTSPASPGSIIALLKGWLSSLGPKAPGTAASFSNLTGAVYNLTFPAPTDGQQTALQTDLRANLRVALVSHSSNLGCTFVADNVDGVAASATAGKVPVVNRGLLWNGATFDRAPGNTVGAFTLSGGYSAGHMATATTTNFKSGAGVLSKITVNSKGTVASTITVYDSLTGTGTVLAVIDSLNLGGTFTYDIAFATGLTLVTTGTIAPDITVSYR